MTKTRNRVLAQAAAMGALAASLLGCGGGDSGGAVPEPAPFSGLWTGKTVWTATGNEEPVTAAALPNGDMVLFATQTCTVWAGKTASSGGKVAFAGTSYFPDLCYGTQRLRYLGDRSCWGSWLTWHPGMPAPLPGTCAFPFSAGGVYSPREAGDLSYEYKIRSAIPSFSSSYEDVSATFSLRFDPIADRGSDLSMLAGTYGGRSGLSVVIAGDGTISGSEEEYQSGSSPGLDRPAKSFSGTLTVVDKAVNLYRLRLVVKLDSSLTPYEFSGFAFLKDSAPGKSNDALVVFGSQPAKEGDSQGLSASAFVDYWIRQ